MPCCHAGDKPGCLAAQAAAETAESAQAELEGAAQQISELLAELSSWRVFFDLNRRMAEWSEQYDAAQVVQPLGVCTCASVLSE